MFAVLVRKELLSNLLTFRLAVALLFTVFLAALTTLIGSLDYSRNMDAYEREVRKAREALDEVAVYSALEPDVVVPPQPLSILCRGILSTAGRTMRVELDRIQIASWPLQHSFESAIMKSLAQIDFATVVGLLLSFLAVVLGFDGISAERERGTLRQMLTNPVPRAYIVLAKLLGGTLSLIFPFAIAFGVSLLIMLANPDVDLSRDDWLRLMLLFLLSCVFLAQAFSLSLMVSVLARNSDTSLIICLFGWLVFGVGYLNVVPSLSRYLVYEPPYQVFQDQSARLYADYDREMADWDRRNPSPGEAYMACLERDGHIRYGHEIGYEWRQHRNLFSVGKLLELADAGYRYRWANQEPLARQAHIVDEWALLSPIANFQVLSYFLARTTLDDSFFLGKAGRSYRQAIIAFLNGKRAMADRRWFSDDPADQEPMIATPETVTPQMLAADSPFMKERMAWVEEREVEAAGDARRRLDLTDLPQFGGQWQRSLPATLTQMTPGLVMLILTLGGSIIVALRRFDRYDPDSGEQVTAWAPSRNRPINESGPGRIARSAVHAVFVHQLQDNLKSLRFQVSLLILLLFFIANGLVYGLKIERTDQETNRLRSVDAQSYDSAKTLRDVAGRWYRIQSDPVGTEFIAEGGFNWSYTGQWVNPRSGQTMWTSLTRTTNNWMRRFEVVDWVVIGRYVLSFLCIVLAYNAVSGERENGTLLLAMANPVARAEFLIAKFLAHFIILEVILVLGCAISLAALVGTGVLEFNAQIARGGWLVPALQQSVGVPVPVVGHRHLRLGRHLGVGPRFSSQHVDGPHGRDPAVLLPDCRAQRRIGGTVLGGARYHTRVVRGIGATGRVDAPGRGPGSPRRLRGRAPLRHARRRHGAGSRCGSPAGRSTDVPTVRRGADGQSALSWIRLPVLGGGLPWYGSAESAKLLAPGLALPGRPARFHPQQGFHRSRLTSPALPARILVRQAD